MRARAVVRAQILAACERWLAPVRTGQAMLGIPQKMVGVVNAAIGRGERDLAAHLLADLEGHLGKVWQEKNPRALAASFRLPSAPL